MGGAGMIRQGVAPLDMVRTKNAKNVLLTHGQMATGRASEVHSSTLAEISTPFEATDNISANQGN